MKLITYKHRTNSNQLFIEEVSVSEIARSVGTPFYCYSKKAISENYQGFASALAGLNFRIAYAIKANFNITLAKILVEQGSGIDAVSAGEIFRAKKAGVNPKNIIFAGVGKRFDEIEYALNEGVEEFSAESPAEIFMLNEVATKLGKKIKLSLRVNPDVDAKTHHKISTGRKGDKFGIDITEAFELYQKARKLPGLEIYGIATHIGSQILTIAPYRAAFSKVRELYLELKKSGIEIKSLDLGGGVGIKYKDEDNSSLIEEYGKLIKEIFADLKVKITIAPGRALVGSSGLLVTKVLLLKKSAAKNLAIIDAAMNDLLRPGLYDAYHEVIPVVKNVGTTIYDLCGPVCETTDVLAVGRKFAELKPNDLLAFCSAGAYGSSMASEYNCRPLIPEVLVDGGNFKVIRRRPSFEEMVRLEV